jgi:hypothetical protein
MFGFNKYSVSILNSNWEVMFQKILVKHIPRMDELIYLESISEYYQVMMVVHNINKNQGIFLIVEKFNK